MCFSHRPLFAGQLDNLLAAIALYPDPLFPQVPATAQIVKAMTEYNPDPTWKLAASVEEE